MIVVDASVVVPRMADDGRVGDIARQALAGHELTESDLIDTEVTSAVRGLTSVGFVPVPRAEQALADLVDLPLVRAPHGALVRRCWELRDNLTPYDAAYVALAERQECVLVTADARLGAAPGPRCEFEVLSA